MRCVFLLNKQETLGQPAIWPRQFLSSGPLTLASHPRTTPKEWKNAAGVYNCLTPLGSSLIFSLRCTLRIECVNKRWARRRDKRAIYIFRFVWISAHIRNKPFDYSHKRARQSAVKYRRLSGRLRAILKGHKQLDLRLGICERDRHHKFSSKRERER